MKKINTDIKISMLNGKLQHILYVIAFLIIVIPMFIAVTANVVFSSLFSKVTLDIALFIIMLAQGISALNKKRAGLAISTNIGIIIGILIALISHTLR